jgi:hypothetical protein
MTGAPGRKDCDYCGAKTGHYRGCPVLGSVNAPITPRGNDPAARCRCTLIRRPHYVGDHE